MLALWRTSVGKKVVMACTGFILFGFVFVHMLGNLKIYQGPDKYNAYAAFLREFGAPALPESGLLWIARIVLLGCVALHALAAVELWLLSRSSRPVPYTRKDSIAAGYATYTMRYGGIVMALFVIYHILHLTFGVTGLGGEEFNHEDVYRNVVNGFSLWYVSFFYILAMIALGLHFYHGIWSMFQTLGLNDARFNRFFQGMSVAAAVIVFFGNVSFPAAVLMGLVKLPENVIGM